MKGTLALQSRTAAADEEAESCFLEAMAIARVQRAKSFELRAAMSLGQLWQRHGKVKKAHALLSETYSWFAEGLETPDLVDARTLLEQLDRRR